MNEITYKFCSRLKNHEAFSRMMSSITSKKNMVTLALLGVIVAISGTALIAPHAAFATGDYSSCDDSCDDSCDSGCDYSCDSCDSGCDYSCDS